MDKYQYRLLQLSIPTRTAPKEQEMFLREVYSKHIDANADIIKQRNAIMLFKEAYDAYSIVLPDYIPASVESKYAMIIRWDTIDARRGYIEPI